MDSFLQTFNDFEGSSLRKQSTFRKPLLVPRVKGVLGTTAEIPYW